MFWHSSPIVQAKPPAGSLLDPTHPLAQGLVGCWLFNEGGGLLANDLAQAHSGTLVGSPSFGLGISFNGSSQRIDFGDVLRVGQNPDARMSIDIRYYARGAVTTAQQLVSKRTGTSVNSDYLVYSSGGDLYWGTGTSADPGAWLPITEPPRNQWHSVVCTLSATGAQTGTKAVFVDGRLAVSSSYAAKAAATADPLRMGAGNASPTQYFNGLLQHVRIYSRALSPYEVAWLYAEPYAMILPPEPRRRYFIPPAAGAFTGRRVVDGSPFGGIL